MVAPISAKIVVSTEEFGGLSNVDPENSTKTTNKLLRLLILATEQGTIAKLLKTLGVGALLKTVGAIGAGVGGALGIVKGVELIGDTLQATDPLTGEIDINRAITAEETKAVAESLGITADEAREQANSQETLTSDTRNMEEKVSDALKALSETPGKANNMNSSIDGVTSAFKTLQERINSIVVPTRISGAQELVDLSGADTSTTAGVLQAIDFAAGSSGD